MIEVHKVVGIMRVLKDRKAATTRRKVVLCVGGDSGDFMFAKSIFRR
jgi:hypothetical protein